MKLPNARAADIAPEKIESYLLSEAHPVGRSKARFFRSLGFGRADSELLRQELLRIAAEGEAQEVEASGLSTWWKEWSSAASAPRTFKQFGF